MAAGWGAAGAEPAGGDSRLRVLTLNLMQKSPIAARGERFNEIARFLKASQEAGRAVDAVLVQEGCSGVWAGTFDSLGELRRALGRAGLRYELYSAPCFGVPVGLVFRIGVLTNTQIRCTASSRLFSRTGNWYDDFPLHGRKRVVMAGVDHPIGRVNLFSTHLSSGGTPEDRLRQAKDLIKFVRDAARRTSDASAQHPADLNILGGDMNNLPGSEVHKLLASWFTDSFAAANPGAPGPTFNLPGNPHCRGYGGGPRRIDYVFYKGRGVEVQSSEVVFGAEGMWVSDHCGVLTVFRRK